MSVRQDFVANVGESFTEARFLMEEDDGSPLNLTGCTAELTLYKYGTTNVVGTYAGTTDASGNVDFNVDAATVLTWTEARYDYKAVVVWPGNGPRERIAQGLIATDRGGGA